MKTKFGENLVDVSFAHGHQKRNVWKAEYGDKVRNCGIGGAETQKKIKNKKIK
jgi:hypothetical protein